MYTFTTPFEIHDVKMGDFVIDRYGQIFMGGRCIGKLEDIGRLPEWIGLSIVSCFYLKGFLKNLKEIFEPSNLVISIVVE